MGRADLKAVIEQPASARVLYFDPPALVETLLDDVVNTPGGLPLLSFALSEMFGRYLARQAADRALTGPTTTPSAASSGRCGPGPTPSTRPSTTTTAPRCGG